MKWEEEVEEQIKERAEKYAEAFEAHGVAEASFIRGAEFGYEKATKKLREENKQLKEKVKGYERTRDRLIEMGFPTFKSCREYADQIEKLQEDLKHKKIAIQNRKARIKELEKRLEQAKKLLAKWVELFKPKCDSVLPLPIQVDTEQFLKENE